MKGETFTYGSLSGLGCNAFAYSTVCTNQIPSEITDGPGTFGRLPLLTSAFQ
jgi:hypothetical protein